MQACWRGDINKEIKTVEFGNVSGAATEGGLPERKLLRIGGNWGWPVSTSFERSGVSQLPRVSVVSRVSALRGVSRVPSLSLGRPVSFEIVESVSNVSPFQNSSGVVDVYSLYATRIAGLKTERLKCRKFPRVRNVEAC